MENTGYGIKDIEKKNKLEFVDTTNCLLIRVLFLLRQDLYNWTVEQRLMRAEYEKKKNEQERLHLEIEDFEGGLRSLLLFESQFGHRNVPSNFPYSQLHDWVERWNPPPMENWNIINEDVQ